MRYDPIMTEIKEHLKRVNVIKTAPDIYSHLHKMGTATEEFAKQAGFSELLIELIKIRTSQINGCAFCLDMHVRDSLAKGESIQRIVVLPAWREAILFTEQEKAALTLAEAVTTLSDGHVSDEVYSAAQDILSVDEITAAISLCVVMNSYNRLAISSRTEVRLKQ